MAETRSGESGKSREKRPGKEAKKEAVYTIPLKRVYWGRRSNRAARAIRLVRAFIARHFGVSPRQVVIYNDVNEYIWSRGIEKPPRYVRVKAVRVEEGEGEEKLVKVKVFLFREKSMSRTSGGTQ